MEKPKVSRTGLAETNWGEARILRQSDNVREGVCSIGTIDFSQGQRDLLRLVGKRSFYFGCGEYDKNGGDCEIRGQVICR